VAIETRDERISPVVVGKPVIDPEKEIPRQDLATPAAKDNQAGLISASIATPLPPAATWNSGAAALPQPLTRAPSLR
jgi:hypothetical protein